MNRIGMLVDLSHVAADTMRDALTVAERAGDLQPLLGTGGDRPARATPPTTCWRRWPGDGGVCMVTFVPKFVNAGLRRRPPRARGGSGAGGRSPRRTAYGSGPSSATWSLDHPQPRATLADVVAHCEHVREVAGIDHIGLGGDYDGVETLPDGLEDVSTYPAPAGGAGRARVVGRRPRPAHLPQHPARAARRRGGGRGPAVRARPQPGPDRGPGRRTRCPEAPPPVRVTQATAKTITPLSDATNTVGG